MNGNTPTPICEECDIPMNRYGGFAGAKYVEGWGCDGCGWSEDDEEYQTPPQTKQPYQIEQEHLFNEWKFLGIAISDMCNIVQNDIKKYPLTGRDVAEWVQLIGRCKENLSDLESRTISFIDKEL